MSRNILLILADAAEAKSVRRSLTDSRHGPFKVEWVNGCGAAIKRLGDQQGEEIAAVVVDLFLADSQGIDTFDKLLRASPHVPILVLSHLRDESKDLHVTVSMGVGVYPTDGADAETLMKNADLALFHSKTSGRANHQFFEPSMRARIDPRSAATS